MGTESSFAGLDAAAAIRVLICEAACFSSATLWSTGAAEKEVGGHRGGVREGRNRNGVLASLGGAIHGPDLLVLALIGFLKGKTQCWVLD